MDLIMKITTVTVICSMMFVLPCFAEETTYPPSAQTKSGLDQYEIVRRLNVPVDQNEADQEMTSRPLGFLDLRRHQAYSEKQVALLTLPEDATPRLTIRQIDIIGNTVISTEALFAGMPLVYNSSDKPLLRAQAEDLYDFRAVKELSEPNQIREISLRTIQGLTRYILSVYQKKGYAGIYVYVPEGVIDKDVEPIDRILPIKVVEAVVSEVNVKFYDTKKNELEKGYLRRSVFEDWSPVKVGKVANRKKLDYLVNLLNQNPDRYVSPVVSTGSEPNTLAVEYDVYETNPWHYFIQVDNSGTDERQWSPRIGVINTNLLGFDDKFTAVYQAKPDATIDDNYSLFGNYDFPLMDPRLRLGFFGGYSEFDINPQSGPFNYLGSGSFYGATLRYNFWQREGWFFDLTSSLSHEESRITPSLFPQFLSSDIAMDLWGIGINVHHRDDMSSTSLILDRTQSIGGSSQRSFWNPLTGTGARTNADRHFAIYTTSANHNQYLDQNKVQKLSGIIRWIWPTERLVPAKMTSFGGMYSVRGYDEYEIVADGGILASLQYEFDLVRYGQTEDTETETATSDDLTKLAPLLFLDYGRTRIKDPVPGEKRHQTLASIGTGAIFEIGENFSGAVNYGYPLKATADTRRGKGRLNVSFMLRW